jgi:hypothetical protein
VLNGTGTVATGTTAQTITFPQLASPAQGGDDGDAGGDGKLEPRDHV